MLTETILLDIASAERQINQLEAELRRLSKPVEIPVDIQTGDLSGVRRELGQADQSVSSLNSELEETTRELRRVDDAAGRAGRELDDTGQRGVKAFGGLGVAVAGFGAALIAVQGLRAFIGFADIAIGKASDLAESTSKTEVVFGDLADNIKQFAGTAPQALGLSTQAALEATASFGNLFTALGLSQDAAADLSPDIVQLAADLASFNNIEVGDALEKLRSGLVGEAEPLRTLGVAINEAAVNAKALELGLVGSTGELSEAAKVQARYALILEQTTTAQGDFARTADGIANKQRTLNAEFDDFQAKVGEALIPAFDSLLDKAPQLIVALEGLIPVIQSIAETIADTEFTGFVTGLVDISRALISIPGVLSGIRDDWFDTGMGNQTLVQSQLVQALVEQLRAGKDPALSLADTLAELGRTDLNPEQFQEVADALIGLTDLEPSRLADLSQLLRRSGVAAGFTADEVQFLREQLVGLQDFQRRKPGGSPLGIDPATVDEEASALERLNSVAQSFDVTDLVGQIQSMADGFSDVAPEIQDLPDLMSDAREALKDEQGGIVEDFDTFFANLKSAFAARQDFQANLLILRALGLDDLADTFEAIGLDAAGALADAITDPTKAAEAERVLEAQARDQAAGFRAAFTAELASMIAVLPVEVQLAQIQIPDIAAALNIRGFSGGGAGGVGDVIVNINNATTNDVTTDAARAGQIIGSVSNRTGGAVRGTG